MANENKHTEDPNATDALFLSIPEALAQGWIQTRYAVAAVCVACPACETLIASVWSDRETRCHGCEWQPAAYPSTADELTEFRRLVLRRRPRGWSVRDAKELRFFLLDQSLDSPTTLRLECTPELLDALGRLTGSGLYGADRTATAQELLRTAVREEWSKWRKS